MKTTFSLVLVNDCVSVCVCLYSGKVFNVNNILNEDFCGKKNKIVCVCKNVCGSNVI